MSGRRSHRLHLGMTTPEEVAAYFEAFLQAFSQGSADVFGRLSKVRSELKNMLWTHPAGTQAGIADALEYLNQLLYDNYGISLDVAMPDEPEPWQQQPYCPANMDTSPQKSLELPAECTQQRQATQTDSSSISNSMTMPQTESSPVKTSAPVPTGDRLHDQPAGTAEAGPRKTDGQQLLSLTDMGPHQKQKSVPSKGVEAPRPTTDLPAAVPATAAFSKDNGRQALQPAPNVLHAQAALLSTELMHKKKAVAFPAGQVPDSLAMDTFTLQELTALPSEHGRIPVSLKSPLPMAAARPAKGRGMGRLPSALTRPARAAQPSPARAAASAASRQRALSKAPGMGSRSAGSQDGSGGVRLGHPVTRKQLQFDTADRGAPGKEAPRSVRGTQATQGLPNQHPEPQEGRKAAAVRGSHQKAVHSHRAHAGSPKARRSLHGNASSDSDTPRTAAAWLSQPVQQAQGINPLFDPQQLQQGSGATVHGAREWVEEMTAIGAAVAGSVSVAGAAGPTPAANQFQNGSTQFNHCHFTQSIPPPVSGRDTASHVDALLQPAAEVRSTHQKQALVAAVPGSSESPEPAKDAGAFAVAGSALAQPSARTAHSPNSAPAAIRNMSHLRVSREPEKTVRFKPVQSAAKHSSLPRKAREVGNALPMRAPGTFHAAQPKHSTTQGSRRKAMKGSQRTDAGIVDAVLAQPAFDYAKALAALDSQGAGHLHQLHSTGSQRREAAFQPLAALLLQPESLRHLDADSHFGASNADEERLATAAHASGVRPGVHMDAPPGEDGASMQPSAVQLQLAENIADAVAAHLNARAEQHAQQEPSTAQTCWDEALAHAAPQAAALNSQDARQPPPSKHAEAAAQLSLQSVERKGSHGRACEEDFLAALLQGSPGRPSHAGQPGRPQTYEQDHLAALLMSPGTSGRVSHAASPGLMHKHSCSSSDSRAGGVSPAADSRAQPWTPQWAGKLTQQQMETAIQEVLAEEVQGFLRDWQCMPELLPQVCSHIAAFSLEACQRHKASCPCVTGAPKPTQACDIYPPDTEQPTDQLGQGAMQRHLPAQPQTSVTAPGSESHSSSPAPGGAVQSPIKEALMHAVLQSLADLCKDGLGDGLAAGNEQKPSLKRAALASIRCRAGDNAGGSTEISVEKEKLLRSRSKSRFQPVQRMASRAVQKGHANGSQGRRAAPVSLKGPRSAGPLIRLKAVLRKPKLPIISTPLLQTAAHAARTNRILPEAESNMGAREGCHKGLPEGQAIAAEQPCALASSAPEVARMTSWQTEQHESTHISSCSSPASEAEADRFTADELPEMHLPVVDPLPAAVAAEARPLTIRRSKPLGVQGSALEGLKCTEEARQGRSHLRCRHQHKHPPRGRHRKPTQPCSSTPSTGPICYSADETEQQYRRQKALAAEERENATKHARPAVREGIAQRRRRLIAEAGLTDSLLFSSDSRSASDSEALESSHCSRSNSPSSASQQPFDSTSDLSSISSASTPEACTGRQVSEWSGPVGSGSSDLQRSSSMQQEASVSARSDRALPDDCAAPLGRSETSRSQGVSATVSSTIEPLLNAQDGRSFGHGGRGADLSVATTREYWPGATWGSCSDVRACDPQHATWGASHHLQERLASVRILPYSMS